MRGAYSAALCYPCEINISLLNEGPAEVPPSSLVSYSRLVMYSFGFQHAFQRGIGTSDNVFLDKVRSVGPRSFSHLTETSTVL